MATISATVPRRRDEQTSVPAQHAAHFGQQADGVDDVLEHLAGPDDVEDVSANGSGAPSRARRPRPAGRARGRAERLVGDVGHGHRAPAPTSSAAKAPSPQPRSSTRSPAPRGRAGRPGARRSARARRPRAPLATPRLAQSCIGRESLPGYAPGTVKLLAVNAVDHPGGAEIGLLRLLRGCAARLGGHADEPARGPLARGRLPVAAPGRRRPGRRRGRAGRRARGRARCAWPQRTTSSTSTGRSPGGCCRRCAACARCCTCTTWSTACRATGRRPTSCSPTRRPSPTASTASTRTSSTARSSSTRRAVDAPWPPRRRRPGRRLRRAHRAAQGRARPRRRRARDPRRRAGRRVVIVGDDPCDACTRDYLAQVRAAREVEHVPWVDNAAGLMRHLDVLVAPSHQEPFGTVLGEAMAVGTPVVATRVGGLAEVVDDGVTGRAGRARRPGGARRRGARRARPPRRDGRGGARRPRGASEPTPTPIASRR